jgi:hypothetical protein
MGFFERMARNMMGGHGSSHGGKHGARQGGGHHGNVGGYGAHGGGYPPPPPPSSGGQTGSVTICAKCQAPGTPGSRFCGQCGAPLEAANPVASGANNCTACGTAFAPESRFCGQCGASRP